jgi:hypothetical protein
MIGDKKGPAFFGNVLLPDNPDAVDRVTEEPEKKPDKPVWQRKQNVKDGEKRGSGGSKEDAARVSMHES